MEDLKRNIEYAALVLETAYLDETRRICEEDDDLAEVTPDVSYIWIFVEKSDCFRLCQMKYGNGWQQLLLGRLSVLRNAESLNSSPSQMQSEQAFSLTKSSAELRTSRRRFHLSTGLTYRQFFEDYTLIFWVVFCEFN